VPKKQATGPRSERRLVEELPEILEARGLSIRAVALSAGVSPSHLGRVLRQSDYKTPSVDLCQRVAHALDLPDDYWPEYRERVVVDRVRSDPVLREELYDRLAAKSSRSDR
jgi:transcriptional regulator with XRE-family HTH domain